MGIREKYGGILVWQGSQFTIVAARTENGGSPFWDEYYLPMAHALNERTIAAGDLEAFSKLREYFGRFADHGPWSNREQLKPVEGTEFFEFKIKKRHRVFFYYDDENRSVVIITHHTVKKQMKIAKEDIVRMRDIRASFEKRRRRDG